ncbi:TRAP transporter substrate-binding protein (plasmid) [Geminicoccaceae bacterium 1502E]|nr:TRAP transporter substrate-binding protein [Geminicoccaceae bacterium 1502E]
MQACRRLFLLAAGALTATLAAGLPEAAAEATYVARIGHLEAPSQPRHQALEKLAALVLERTGGEVELQLFPSSQLGNARQMVEGTQFGAMEGTVMPAAFLGGFNPVVSVLDLPFLFPADREKAQELRQGPLGDYILESFESRGLAAVALWPNGRKNVTSAQPMDEIAAFAGQKFRVMDSRILIEQFSALGASAVVIPFGELYTALQTGVVDGQENPLDTIATMKYFEVQKHLVLSEHGAMEDVFLFSPAWWGSLPEGHREVITAAIEEVRPEVEQMKEAAQEKALETIRAAGVEVRELGADERRAWRELMFPKAEAAYLERAGEEGRKALEIYRDEVERLGLAN